MADLAASSQLSRAASCAWSMPEQWQDMHALIVSTSEIEFQNIIIF